MSAAERQRRYRERNGARVGDHPGPQATEPCGTLAAHRRHKRNGEPIDDACRATYNAEHRRLYSLRRG